MPKYVIHAILVEISDDPDKDNDILEEEEIKGLELDYADYADALAAFNSIKMGVA